MNTIIMCRTLIRTHLKNKITYKITLTCVSVTFNNFAISVRSLELRYFLISNCFSNSNIWRPVKVVLAFFLRLASVDPESESSSVVSILTAGGVVLIEGGAKRSLIKLSLLPDGLTSGGRVTLFGASVEESFFFFTLLFTGPWCWLWWWAVWWVSVIKKYKKR